RPRARGRAGRIRKRTCHVTMIVSRLPEEQLTRLRARQAAEQAARRGRRLAGSRGERTGRRRGAETLAEEPTAAEVPDAQEEQGIVDTDAAGVAEVEAIEADA